MTPKEARRALSARLRQERRDALNERRAREAALFGPICEPAATQEPANPPESLPVQVKAHRGLTGILVLRPAGKPATAPNTCRRPTWAHMGPLDSHLGCPSGVTPSLHNAYALWAEHHALCPTCSWQDWYTPGHVKVCEQLLADGKLTTKDGKIIYFRYGPDHSVLCATGAALFKQWEREASRTWNPAILSDS